MTNQKTHDQPVLLNHDQFCPLCNSQRIIDYHQDRIREYLQCQRCELVFVPARYFLSLDEEKAYYDTHDNNPADPDYRRFLERLILPLKKKLRPGSRGLDFGSGPGPTLSVMLQELGFSMNIYDIHYANDPAVLQKRYDFIASTETVEHLHHPGSELQRLWSLLYSGGHFAIMTQFVLGKDRFANWGYIRDPTHVCFFSKSTFEWLAQQWQAPIEFAGNGVVLMTKP